VPRGFFDAIAGQPLHPAAAAALRSAAGLSWADPTANYYEAGLARQLLDAARSTVAAVAGVEPGRVSFRSAGTDAAQAAAHAVTSQNDSGANRVAAAASAVERQVVIDAIDSSATESTRLIKVDATATIDLVDLKSALDDQPALAAIQAANTELATLQPLRAAAGLCQASRVPLLVDATGALGIVAVPTGWTGLFSDAAGWAGPREAAIVVAPPGQSAPDTIGLPTIVATAAALDAVWRESGSEHGRLLELTGRIREFVGRQLSGAWVLGTASDADRLPHIVALSIPDVDAALLQSELDQAGFAVGSGSACANGGRASHVLQAASQVTQGNIRISLPWRADEDSVMRLIAQLPRAVERVRERTQSRYSSSAISDPRDDNPTLESPVAVDAIGLRCPRPIIKLGRAAREAPPGAILELRTDDPGALADVGAWCRMSGATLLSQIELVDYPNGCLHMIQIGAQPDCE